MCTNDAWKLLRFLMSTGNTAPFTMKNYISILRSVAPYNRYIRHVLEWVKVLDQVQQVVSWCLL